jgi:exo-beta-1,3-glucanase (GH17 family)
MVAWLLAASLLIGCGQRAPTMTPTAAPSPTLTATPTSVASPTAGPTPPAPTPVMSALPDFSLCWVAYSPTEYNPDVGKYPLKSIMREDLRVLYTAGFAGIITYGANGTLDSIPQLAKEAGFAQVVMGVWNPLDADEMAAAVRAAPFVDGYLVGNEGIGDGRYSFDGVRDAIHNLRAATGKPVTTSERIDAYSSDELLALGDWVSPIVHPYWYDWKQANYAAEWTAEQYADLRAELPPDRFLQFKEVGLPTAGDAAVSEEAQAEYYQALQETGVVFVYFEAFDQFWKAQSAESAVGPHWGLFTKERTPKVAAHSVCGRTPSPATVTPALVEPAPPSPTTTPAVTVTAPVSIPTEVTPTARPLAHITDTATLIVYDGKLSTGFELGIDNENHQYGWIEVETGALRADFLPDQAWAAVMITIGKPKKPGERTATIDLSACQTLSVTLRATTAGVEVSIGMKDQDDPDDGSETLLSVVVNPQPSSYHFALPDFASADLSRIYLPFELVYFGDEAVTIFIDRIDFQCH